jgi:hypothetical protein
LKSVGVMTAVPMRRAVFLEVQLDPAVRLGEVEAHPGVSGEDESAESVRWVLRCAGRANRIDTTAERSGAATGGCVRRLPRPGARARRFVPTAGQRAAQGPRHRGHS